MKDRLNQIANEVGTWAARNFPVHAPDLGMLEETGELCHCFLKRAQKIRGFDNPEHFLEHATDAIADIAVYNSHFIFLSKIPLESDPVCRPGLDLTDIRGIRRLFSRMTHDVSSILSGALNRAGRPLPLCILDHLVTVSDAIEIDFMETLEMTWAKVKQRDWAKNRESAHLVNENP